MYAITSQFHCLQRKTVVKVYSPKRVLSCLLQELLEMAADIPCQGRVQSFLQKDLFIPCGHLRQSGVFRTVQAISLCPLRTRGGGAEDGFIGSVHAGLFSIYLSDEVVGRLVQDVPASSHIEAEVAGGSLQKDRESLTLQSTHQGPQGLFGLLLLIRAIWQVLPLQHCLLTSESSHCILDQHMHLVSQFDQLCVILRLSEQLDVGILSLAIGIDPVDMRVHQCVERVHCSHGVQEGPIGDGLPTAEVAVQQVPPVTPQVVHRVHRLRQALSCCQEGTDDQECARKCSWHGIESIQMQQIQALRFDVEEVGKHVKGSKKRYCWEIALRDKAHTIVLDFSFLSGKIKITVDRKILLENELPADVAFQYPFNLDGFALNIIQQGQSFQLRINNKVFSHLYTQQKTNTEFKKYEDEVKDIKVDINQLKNPQGKKISLNIGAFGGQGGMKKKKETSGGSGDGWNAFAGGSFPSYFGQSEPAKAEKNSPVKKSNLLDDQEETAVAARTANEFNLTAATRPEQKQQPDIFQLVSSEPSSTISQGGNSQQFSNMQEMFNSLSVSNNNNKANELDFFADQPKPKEVQAKPPTNKPPAFDFAQQGSGLGNFGTGFGLQGMGQVNSKAFATTSGAGSKGFDLNSLDFSLNAPQKQEPVNAFSKKTAVEGAYSPMDQLFAAQPPSNPPSMLNQTPNINDFNTMQLMFQTNSNFTPPQDFRPPQQTPPPQPFQGNAQDFGTSMYRMFQTNTPPQGPPLAQMNLNVTLPPEPQQKPQNNPLDLFSNNKPATFATTSGANFQGGFDMSAFGTMQANPKSGVEINFFDAKPAPKGASSNSGDLI